MPRPAVSAKARLVLFLALGASALRADAQDRRPGSAPPPAPAAPNPDAIMRDLANGAQGVAASEKCNWNRPIRRQAATAVLAITEADLKSMIAPEARPQVDAILQQARGQVASFACKLPNGDHVPQKQAVEKFLDGRYDQAVAMAVAFDQQRYGGASLFTPEERAVLDEQVTMLSQSNAAGMAAMGTEATRIAERTSTVACHVRALPAARCAAIPPDLQGAMEPVRARLTAIAAFGKAMAGEVLEFRRRSIAEAYGGEPAKFAALKPLGSCYGEGYSLRLVDAPSRLDPKPSTLAGGVAAEVTYAPMYSPSGARTGWMLLYRLVNPTQRTLVPGQTYEYYRVAMDGRDWKEQDAKAAAGQVDSLPADIAARVAALDATAYRKAAVIADLKKSMVDTYFSGAVAAASRAAIEGRAPLQLEICGRR